MKKIYRLVPVAALLLSLASCAESELLSFEAEKPVTIENQEQIDAYADLKTYVDKSVNGDFKLGAGISLSDYVNRDVIYRLVNRNFDEITLGYEMKHGAVVKADGSMDFDKLNKLLEEANKANISVFGHTLCWHANQNAEYLKSIIAPIVIPSDGGPGWDLITGIDFEDENTSQYQVSAGATSGFSAAGQGGYGSGRAFTITNPTVKANDWEVQLFVKISPSVQVGEKYELKMDIRSDDDASFSTQAHVTPGAYKHWDFFGTLSSTSAWSTYTREITISAEQADCGAIAFNLGSTATTFYFDNIKLTKYNETGGATTIDRTPEEKKEIIADALDQWITGMVTNSAATVKAWDVVNEPMDDAQPYELKTGVGKATAGDEFYWQDYLGKDYAVEAFRLARQHGNSGDKLFINDYNLEYNLDKCRGLIQYVNYIESKGQTVDGIGTQMHININSDKANIETMFQLLAATGKLIKVSELDVVAGEGATKDDLLKQAEMYKFVVDMYTKYIPKAQRYGITVWGLTDSKPDASWLPGKQQGLWNVNYTRKPSYASFAEGLKALK
jgi:endo-1,4-beta-xylanase